MICRPWHPSFSSPQRKLKSATMPSTPLARLAPPLILLLTTAACARLASAQAPDEPHRHHAAAAAHGSAAESEPPAEPPPKIFFNKSPRVVAYQLKRLDNQRLLRVPRNDEDPKYAPVHEAILRRPGMPPAEIEAAVAALAKLNEQTPITVLLNTLGELRAEDAKELQTADRLTSLLLRKPAKKLAAGRDALLAAAAAKAVPKRLAGFAGLLAANDSAAALDAARSTPDGMRLLLQATPHVPNPNARKPLRSAVLAQLQSDDVEVRRAAIVALGSIPAEITDTYARLAARIADVPTRPSVLKTLLKLDAKRGTASAPQLLADLVDIAEQTAAADRTSDPFVDLLQLADQLMPIVAPEQASSARRRLRAISVRVVRIKTVEEQMRYDTPYFAVEAGRSVQVILDNHDQMPHNWVLTRPGTLKQVAMEGLQAGPQGGWQGKPYVPESDDVLQATPLVAAGEAARLTFDAPAEPGEYPYVCTFPQHWQRMYGVMVVVRDLDAWLQDPTPPTDPIGSNRSFVKAWQTSDLAPRLPAALRGRSAEIGKRLFAEASCANCHRMHGQGGEVGPELTDVLQRWKGDPSDVLREIIEPSHRIEPKYAAQIILTVDGRTHTGLIRSENDNQVELIEDPAAKAPTVIAQDDIEEIVPARTSLMPKALLDQYTEDEIFELLAYICGASNP